MSLPCGDFREFKRVLQDMRVVDDKIVYELNLAVPTPTFEGTDDNHNRFMHSDMFACLVLLPCGLALWVILFPCR